MNQREIEFAAKLLQTFKLEADEHLKMLSDGLLALENASPSENQKDIIEKIFREAHSLKGAARAVNQYAIQNICQNVENVLAALKTGQFKPTKALFDALYMAIDLIGNLVSDALKGEVSNQDKLPMAMEKLNELLKGNLVLENTAPKDVKAIAPKPTQPIMGNLPKSKPLSAQVGSEGEKEAPKKSTIRVSLQKLDALFHQTEEMLVVKLASRQQVVAFRSIQKRLAEWEKECEVMEKRLHLIPEPSKAYSKGMNEASLTLSRQILTFLDEQRFSLKSFKDELNRLDRATSQNARLVGSLVDSLLDDTKRVLMQPFSTLLETFPRMIRDISHSLNKAVRFDIQGADIEIDRRILEELKDPLIHLIRNAIDHAIETSEERIKLGKPPQGVIAMTAMQVSGNSVEISLSDDGKGIDLEKVKESALREKIITEKELAGMNDQEIVALIFQSGVSTSSQVTELSGRGLGMKIVSEKVEKLGGQIFIETKLGVGTIFRIRLPLTMATFRGIHIRAYDRDFIMPIYQIKRILRIKPEEIRTIENRETISFEERTLSYVHLGDLLGISPNVSENRSKRLLIVLVVKASETTIAFGVEQLLNEQEILVKGLGAQLIRIRNIAAATVMEWGKVIPILNPNDLVKTALGWKIQKQNSFFNPPVRNKALKTILLAEDSVTTRVLFKNILESAGYLVKAVTNGLEALAVLKSEKFDLLLSDIEMPGMDGLELTKKIRASAEFKNLPIVLCTGRGLETDRIKGFECGANAYLDKNSFAQSGLLETIRRLIKDN